MLKIFGDNISIQIFFLIVTKQSESVETINPRYIPFIVKKTARIPIITAASKSSEATFFELRT